MLDILDLVDAGATLTSAAPDEVLLRAVRALSLAERLPAMVPLISGVPDGRGCPPMTCSDSRTVRAVGP